MSYQEKGGIQHSGLSAGFTQAEGTIGGGLVRDAVVLLLPLVLGIGAGALTGLASGATGPGLWGGGLAGGVAGLVITAWEYWALVLPIRRLGGDLEAVAAGDITWQVRQRGLGPSRRAGGAAAALAGTYRRLVKELGEASSRLADMGEALSSAAAEVAGATERIAASTGDLQAELAARGKEQAGAVAEAEGPSGSYEKP